MARRRRVRLPQDLNVLAVLVVLCAFVLVLTDDLLPEAFLLLVTGLAIPARSTGYQDSTAAPIVATPTTTLPEQPGPGDR